MQVAYKLVEFVIYVEKLYCLMFMRIPLDFIQMGLLICYFLMNFSGLFVHSSN